MRRKDAIHLIPSERIKYFQDLVKKQEEEKKKLEKAEKEKRNKNKRRGSVGNSDETLLTELLDIEL
jgi:hypothetical protein